MRETNHSDRKIQRLVLRWTQHTKLPEICVINKFEHAQSWSKLSLRSPVNRASDKAMRRIFCINLAETTFLANGLNECHSWMLITWTSPSIFKSLYHKWKLLSQFIHYSAEERKKNEIRKLDRTPGWNSNMGMSVRTNGWNKTNFFAHSAEETKKLQQHQHYMNWMSSCCVNGHHLFKLMIHLKLHFEMWIASDHIGSHFNQTNSYCPMN